MLCSISAARTGGGPALPQLASARRRFPAAAAIPWPAPARSTSGWKQTGPGSGSFSKFCRYRCTSGFLNVTSGPAVPAFPAP
jgi:hypothetical protein